MAQPLPSSGLGGHRHRTRRFEQDLVLGRQEAAEVVDRVLCDGHLAQVVLPDVRLDGAPREGLARHLYDLSYGVDAGIGDGRYHEAHVGAGAPEAADKLLREDEREVAAFAGQQGKGFFCAGPDGADLTLKPAAELKPVKLSL